MMIVKMELESRIQNSTIVVDTSLSITSNHAIRLNNFVMIRGKLVRSRIKAAKLLSFIYFKAFDF